MKDTTFLHLTPIFHWTDQKIKVHALYCIIALQLVGLLRRQLAKDGIHVSVDQMLTALSKINEVAVIYPESTQRHAKSCVTYSRLDSLQKQMVQKFQLNTFYNGREKLDHFLGQIKMEQGYNTGLRRR
jgi:hypothetical protein